MKWTNTTPTAPGLYWVRYAGEKDAIPVYLSPSNVGLLIERFGVQGMVSPNDGDWATASWFGPMEPPPENPNPA